MRILKIVLASALFFIAFIFLITGIMSFTTPEMGPSAGIFSLAIGALCVWGGIKLIKKAQVNQKTEAVPIDEKAVQPPPSVNKKSNQKPVAKKVKETVQKEYEVPEGKIFHIMYKSSDGELSERDIEIKKFVEKDGKTFIYAYCHLRKAVRSFLMSRITSITCEGRQIADIREYLGHDLKPIAVENLVDLALEDAE